MKEGDLVLFCDPASAEVEPVLLIRLVPDSLKDGRFAGAEVMNEHGTHWVRMDHLVDTDEAGELLDELREYCG